MLVKFTHEESGKLRKLSRPWHGPYRVTQRDDPDVTVVKVYFPEDGPIQVHQSSVSLCPMKLLTGFYWYGGQKKSPGRLPPWLAKLLSGETEKSTLPDQPDNPSVNEADSESEPELNDVDNDDPTAESSQDPIITTPPPTNQRYSLRNRDGGVQPPNRLM